MDELSALQASGLFGDATIEELAALRPALRRRFFVRGAHLWHAGDATGTAVIILSGLVKTCHVGASGREIVISVKGPMETTGEYHLFATDTVRSFDAVAVERTECVAIARDLLMFQLERHPRLMRRLAAALLERSVRENSEALLLPAAGDITGRLAFRLLGLAERHGEPAGSGVRIPFVLTQSLLAGLTGGSREKVNRAISRLLADGVIGRDAAGSLVLQRLEDLRELSGRE